MTKEELNQKTKVWRWEVNNWLYRQEEKAKRLWNNHKQEILVFGPGAIALTQKLIREVNRGRRIKEDKHHREKTVYNRSCGSYIELRRKLTANEQLELDRRKRNGESIAEILSDMGVMKKK